MAIEIKLPSLGEGVESGDVLEVYVKVGDTVKKDQALFELETDKATVAVPSPQAGKVLSITVKEGETVKVGQVVGTLEGVAAPSAPAPAASVQASAPAAPAQASAPAAPAASVAPAQVAPVAATSAPVAPAPVAPAPVKPSVVTPAPLSPAPISASVNPQAPSPQDSDDDVIAAGPAIRRFAREVGVDLTGVTGSGEHGRITREDVLSIVRNASQQQSTKQSSAPAASAPVAAPSGAGSESGSRSASGKSSGERPGTAATDDFGPIRVDRLTKIRKTIANQMDKSWSTVPRVVNFDDADVTELEAFRQSSKDDYASRGIKLTTMPFLIKAIATALKHHPALNAMIDMENDQIIYKDYVNLGIAIDTERGLVVPTLKNADRMSIPDIAYALSELSNRVRNNDFAVSDLRGGTFTISNLGAIGGTYSTPIVNVPEVAILLVGRSRKLATVMDDDSIKPRLMMPLSLAYDHRLVDGATAARFLNDIIAYLEAPSRLLLAI